MMQGQSQQSTQGQAMQPTIQLGSQGQEKKPKGKGKVKKSKGKGKKR